MSTTQEKYRSWQKHSCSFCKDGSEEAFKIKRGWICKRCYHSLPDLMKQICETMTVKEIKEYKTRFCQRPSGYIARYKQMEIYQKAIVVGGCTISISEIESIKLRVHPIRYVGANVCEGFYVLYIYLKDGIALTYPLSMEKEFIRFKTENKKIVDFTFPRDYLLFISIINRPLQEGESDFSFVEQFFNDTRRQNEENRKREQSHQQAGSSSKTEFSEANKIFKMVLPFTESELKKKRNKLIKENHPDAGGSAEVCAQINLDYETLSKYAS